MEFLLDKQRENIPFIGNLGKLSENDLKRILEKINVKELDEKKCWIWDKKIWDTKKGHQHSKIWYNKKGVLTHRIMYHNFIEDVPEYEYPYQNILLHKCSHENNGKCINPWHLKLGTPKENSQDALHENTLTIYKNNERNPNSKLTNNQIEEIRKLKNSNLTQKEIAKKYNINQSQVSRYFNKTRNID